MKITTIVCDKCGREDLNEEDGFILLGSSTGKDLKYEVIGEYKEKKKPELSNELTYLGSYHDLHFCNHECFFQYFGKPLEAVDKEDPIFNRGCINSIPRSVT